MNFRRGRTNKRLMVKIRPRNKPNYAFPVAYNYTQDKHSWDIVLERANNRTLTNHSMLYAKNDFLKKSKVLTEMKPATVKSHSFTTVIVISSMFLFFTISLTAAVVVFCRKRNTVFALQKCEEDDDADDEQEYELDDLNTDVEYPSEYESESRRQSSQQVAESPLHQPLMPPSSTLGAPGTYDSDPEHDYAQHLLPSGGENKHYNYSSTVGSDQRGMYQRMVVTAVMENETLQHDNTNTQPLPARSKMRDKIQKKYQDFAQLTHADIESEFTAYPMTGNLPVISISYADEPPSYDSLSYHSPTESMSRTHPDYQKIPYVELTEIPVRDQCNNCKSCNVIVTLPDATASLPQSSDSSTVLFVDLPPKSSRASSSSLSTSSSSMSSSSSFSTGSPPLRTANRYEPHPSHSTSLPATPLEPPSCGGGGGNGQWSSSCVSITTALEAMPEAAAVAVASWSDLQEEAPARRPCSISFTRESGIADLLSPTTLMTPISPPPGFRNDDCFITPSSTNDSGVMVANVT